MSTVYLGLGSNLNQPIQQLRRAIQTLQVLPEVTLEQVSRFYRSAPWGGVEQPDFMNAVAKVTTDLGPLDLLDILQSIEKQQQRVREQRWGPRTLDLDILLFDALQLDCDRLVVPHPYLAERPFVVYPLHEIAPELVLPSGELLTVLKAKLAGASCRVEVSR